VVEVECEEMSDEEQSENEARKDIRSILSSLENNRFWPFAEGVYLLDDLKPWAAAVYSFITIILDNEAALEHYDACVDQCDQQVSGQFRQIASNLLTRFPLYAFKYKGSSESLRKSMASRWHRQFWLRMKQYFAEKGRLLTEIIDPWLQEHFKPARGDFGNIVPMSGLLHVAMVYETIIVPLVEEPPEVFKAQSFYEYRKPTTEVIQFLQAFREGTGIADPGSWEALREPEFYKALKLSRKMARAKVEEAKKKLVGIRCYGERTMLRDAYCFKRVVIDGEKEADVTDELRGFRQAQYMEAQRLFSPYYAANGSFFLKKAILGGTISQRVLNILFTAEEIKQAPRMLFDWKVKAKIYDKANPTENEVSKEISPFAMVFDYPRSPGRPSSKT